MWEPKVFENWNKWNYTKAKLFLMELYTWNYTKAK